MDFFSIICAKQHPSNDHHFSGAHKYKYLFQTLQFFSGHPIYVWNSAVNRWRNDQISIKSFRLQLQKD